MFLADAVRLFDVAAALLLAVLVLRLLWVRKGLPRERRSTLVHPLTALSYVGFLLITVTRRLDRLGETPDGYLVAATLCIAAGVLGVGSKAVFTTDPPWSRKRAERRRAR